MSPARSELIDREVLGRRCWESLERHLPGTEIEQLYGGFSYLAVGTAGGPESEENTR